ncbi:peptidase S8 and S53 subtilisin kexin sedolisin, partial [filamentous cyanobacterium CCP5]
RVHDVLYVIAGNQGGGGIPIPTDNYNGINVAYSRLEDGTYSKVDFANLSSEPDFRSRRSPAPETNEGARRSINITAPGSQIDLIDPDGRIRTASGTSFAAPHVVGTLALIQQLADRQIRAGLPNWNLDARRAMVSKVILLNSADKLADTGDGLRLGMARTLRDESNRTWIDSDAYANPMIPLNKDMGTGHLNAYRAYQQFLPGAFTPDQAVPAIGWNYDGLSLAGSSEAPQYQDYKFEAPLKAGSYLSATLAWERVVDLNDANGNGIYDIGETFSNRGLNNLDMYLMPADANDLSESIWSSVSAEDSLEHIFYQIPQTGRYKLRVVFSQQVHNQPIQPYALAWWAVADAPNQ